MTRDDQSNVKGIFLHHFSVIEDSIAKTLLSACHIKAVNELFSLFPLGITADFGFETRLANPEATCDLFFMIKKEQEGVAILAGNSHVAGLSPILLNHPFWKKLSALFKAWTDPDSILFSKLEVIWFEFDYQVTSHNLIPNLFFSIKKEDKDSALAEWDSIHRVLDEIYRLLFGIIFPEELAGTLKQSILSLPDEARICMVGFTVPRKTEAVRVLVSGLKKDSLSDYLQSVEWHGDQDAVLKLISRYKRKFDYEVYNSHIGAVVLPILGIEMYYKELRQPTWEPRWKEAFDLLEQDELLISPKRLGLTGFVGRKIVSGLFGLRYLTGINHLKLVYSKGLPIECKGYFGI